MANIFSDFWYRINKKLVPRNSKVTETSSDFIIELQNANEDKPADRETLVSFSIPKGTSFTPQDRQQVNAALETFKNVSSISSDQWADLKNTSKLENRITAAEKNFDALEIGGRNLLRGSKDFSGATSKPSKATYSTETVGGADCTVLSLDNSAGNSDAVIAEWRLSGIGTAGAVYTASFWFKGSGQCNMFFYGPSGHTSVYRAVMTINGSSKTYSSTDGYVNFLASGSTVSDWTRCTVVYTLSSTVGTTTKKYLMWRISAGATLSIALPMLERSTKPSDWTPAPEDKADVSALAKKADVSTLAEKADVSVILPSASVESSTTASQAYSVDSLIMVNGALRRVTSVIKKGDTISDSNSTVTTVSSELSRLSHQSTISEYSNVPHGELRLNINNNRTHQLYGTAIVRNDEWDSIWSNSVKCPGISDNNWYIKTNFKVWTPSKAYNVPCAGIFIGGISQYVLPENFNNAIYYVGSDGQIYIPIGSSKPTTTYLWFFWGRVAEENTQ